MDFCNKLRLLIEENNLTQKRVALDLNIAPSTIGGYVQGVSEPDFDTLKRFAAYFDVSTDYLLDVNHDTHESPLEPELLRVFRTLSHKQQLIYIEQGKAFKKIKSKDANHG